MSPLRIATVLLALLLVLTGCAPFTSGGREFHALFPTSAGLFVGNDVGVLGVPVGTVTAIEPRGAHVLVTFHVEGDRPIPRGAYAVIASRSLATDRYVELTPVYAGGPQLADDATIAADHTRVPVEWDEVLGSLNSFNGGLLGADGKGTDLARLISSGARALHGKGGAINAGIHELATAMQVLSAHRDDVTGTIGHLDRLTAGLAANDQAIRRFIDSVAGATQILAAERQSFGQTMTSLGAALSELASFIRQHQAQLRRAMTGLTTVSGNLLRHRARLVELVEVLPLLTQNIRRAVQNGRLQVKVPPSEFAPGSPLVTALCKAAPSVCNSIGNTPSLPRLPGGLGTYLNGLTGGAR